MKKKDITSCEECPLHRTLCFAGEFNPSSQSAFEPECAYCSDDIDMDDFFNAKYETKEKQEEESFKEHQNKLTREENKKKGQRKRSITLIYTREVRRQMLDIKKRIKSLYFANSLQKAFSIANTVYDKPTSEFEKQPVKELIEKYEKRYLELDEKRKQIVLKRRKENKK